MLDVVRNALFELLILNSIKMNRCYLCNIELTNEVKSVEHIIPNVLCGRLKSASLLCKKCNNKTGELLDAELAKLGNIMASKLNIKRDRGNIPSFQAFEVGTNKKLLITPGFERKYLEPEIDNQINGATVFAYSLKRVKQELERIKKLIADTGLKAEESKFGETVIYDKKDFSLKITLDSDIFIKGICKILINYYIYKTGNSCYLESVIKFLKDDCKNIYGWHFDLNVSKLLHENKPYHILIIKGDSDQKALYGYFEMFGKKGQVVLLNNQYTGEEIQLDYTFDPVEGKEIQYEYSFKLIKAELEALIAARPGPDPNYKLQL